jgi:putative ABC transport system permease protein
MIVAADVTSGAILNAFAESGDALTFMAGLLDQLDVMLMSVGVGITFAAGFLVFNAFAMSITQRRQQIGALRSLGMTRRQVMRLVLVEALITGGAGTLLGLIAGPLLGRSTIALIKAMFGEGLFVFAASSASPTSFLLAAVSGIVVTLLSVLIPARQATRISPLVALREKVAAGVARNPVGRALAGLLIAVVLAVYLAVAPPGEWVELPWDVTLTGSFVLVWLACLALITPALIGGVGSWGRRSLTRLWGATGRLIADNLQRGRGRVMLTILTLAVALTMIVTMTGFLRFTFDELMLPKIESIAQQGTWGIASFDISEGMSAYSDLDTIEVPLKVIAEVQADVEGRARVSGMYYVIVPELSFLGSSYFSLVSDPLDTRLGGDSFFSFTEGDWETAVPIMESGCGVLVAPAVASKNGVLLGETFRVTGVDGPIECTVAGIGSPMVGASIISKSAGEAFGITNPMLAMVMPLPGVDLEALETDLTALVNRHPNLVLNKLEDMVELQTQMMDVMPNMLNALLLLAIVAAALGVVNTTVMGVAERRRELGLLRAVGATRRQVTAVVAGEAALMGFIGGGLGLVAGAGIIVILAVVYGGNSWGVPDLDLWGAAWRSVQPALLNGLVGLVVAPFICAGAAWLPVRAILRGSIIETMEAERQ